MLVSQLNNYTLAPISDERVSEAAGVNSAAGSFGLSFGLAFAGAIMLATLSITFTNMAQASAVLPPAEQEQVSQALEEDAEVMSTTQLEELLVDQPEDVQAEIVRINTDAREVALQVALLVPLLAGLLGLVTGFRMTRLPDPGPSASQWAPGTPYASPTLPALTTCHPSMSRSNCMCVCPQTTRSASTPASMSRSHSSGVVLRIISSSLRGDPWQKSTWPTPSTSSSICSGSAAMNSR